MFGTKKKTPEFKFDLGDELLDTITGFQGICTARHQWIHNCNTYSLQHQKLKDGKPIERETFDEPQLKIVKKEVIKSKRNTGGPTDAPSQTNRL